MTVLKVDFQWISGARAQDKTKQYHCCFFFSFFKDFIQLCYAIRAISLFACNLTRNSLVMNFSIESTLNFEEFARICPD